MFNINVWDYWADKYENLWVQKYSLTPTRKALLDALIPLLDRSKKYKILDMGCGTGQLLKEMQDTFKGFDIEYTGVDISPKMIEICKSKDLKASFYVSNIEVFNPGTEEFDIILCSHSFPYYPNKKKTVDRFYNLLKKDGLLLLAQASANSLYDEIIMFFVKFTTGRAQYLSIPRILDLAKNKFREIGIIKIKERFYMPTICLFLLQKEDRP